MVWLLTGIWHGAKWTYIVWGMMYFVLLCVERILNLSGQKSWLGWIYTVFFFIAGLMCVEAVFDARTAGADHGCFLGVIMLLSDCVNFD